MVMPTKQEMEISRLRAELRMERAERLRRSREEAEDDALLYGVIGFGLGSLFW